MPRLMDILFALAIITACFGLDFSILKRAHGDTAFGLAHYIAQRQADLNELMRPPGLADVLPSTIEGWAVAKLGAERLIQDTADNPSAQVGEIAAIKAVVAQEKALYPIDDMVVMRMTKEDTSLYALATLVQQSKPIHKAGLASQETAVPQIPLQTLLQNLPPPSDAPPFMVVDGVAITELPLPPLTGKSNIRMMRADLGGTLFVTFVTTSRDDAALQKAMDHIDFVMLNMLLKTPVSGVEIGRTTDLRADAANAPAPAIPPSAPPAPAPSAPSNPAVADVTPPPTKAEDMVAASEGEDRARGPCVRRAGVLVCP